MGMQQNTARPKASSRGASGSANAAYAASGVSARIATKPYSVAPQADNARIACGSAFWSKAYVIQGSGYLIQGTCAASGISARIAGKPHSIAPQADSARIACGSAGARNKI